MLHLEAMFDPVSGAQVVSALTSFLPRPDPVDPAPDAPPVRTARQRRADAMVDLCLVAMKGRASEAANDRVRMTVTVPLSTLSQPGPVPEGGTRRQRRARHRPPVHPGGDVPRGGVPRGDDAVRLEPDGETVCAETARRLACDAEVIPAVLGSAGEPLDIGRLSRVIPTGLRRALVLRDQHCRFPGCDRPPAWCDGHHVVAWSRGGPTALDNLVLLCAFHHTLVHEGRWRLSLDPASATVRVRRPDGTLHDLVSRRGDLPP
jgi:hypothetical protein